MADRDLDRVATLSADLPGGDSDTIFLTVTDPFGTVIVDAVNVPSLGKNRYRYTTTVLLDIEGIYSATWHYQDKDSDVHQQFTVGLQPVYGISKFDARIQIASRVSRVFYGQVSVADENLISDDSLIGGSQEFRYWWIMLDPSSNDAGRVFRVRDYNGQALELSSGFITIPDDGQTYILFDIDPREIDRAINLAISELAQQARIDMRLTNLDLLVDADDRVVLPPELSHVSELWSNGTKLLPTEWSMMPNRRIQFSTTPDAPTEVVAQRSAAAPVWEDSILEIDPPSLVARASNFLHASRAGGAAIDNEEHLRRQLAASDEYERVKRGAVGRIPPGSRAVIV